MLYSICMILWVPSNIANCIIHEIGLRDTVIGPYFDNLVHELSMRSCYNKMW